MVGKEFPGRLGDGQMGGLLLRSRLEVADSAMVRW
jgi:hypothetical protein